MVGTDSLPDSGRSAGSCHGASGEIIAEGGAKAAQHPAGHLFVRREVECGRISFSAFLDSYPTVDAWTSQGLPCNVLQRAKQGTAALNSMLTA